MLFNMRVGLKALHDAKVKARDAMLGQLKLDLATAMLDWAARVETQRAAWPRSRRM